MFLIGDDDSLEISDKGKEQEINDVLPTCVANIDKSTKQIDISIIKKTVLVALLTI